MFIRFCSSQFTAPDTQQRRPDNLILIKWIISLLRKEININKEKKNLKKKNWEKYRNNCTNIDNVLESDNKFEINNSWDVTTN